MTDNYKEIDFKIKESKSIYPFYAKLLGKGSGKIEILKLKGCMGEIYKLVRINKRKSANISVGILEEAIKYLRTYSGSGIVPELVFGNEKQILVKWIEGTPLSLREMGEVDYINLGKFVGSSIRERIKIESRSVIEETIVKCDELKSKGIIELKLKRNIEKMIEGPAKPNALITEGICFGDTALKNFVKDNEGKLHYIDVLGIYRAPIGQKAVKQMNTLPRKVRKGFLSEYKKAAQVTNNELNVGFYQIVFLVNRIHAKHNKSGFLKKMSGRKKAKESIYLLKSFVDAGVRGSDLEKFVTSP